MELTEGDANLGIDNGEAAVGGKAVQYDSGTDCIQPCRCFCADQGSWIKSY